LQDKSKTQDVLKKFLKRAQNEFDAKVKKIRSDNGIEFKNTQLEDFLNEEGIKHEFSVPYTPQQDGVAERKNRTLIEMVRTMLDEYKASDQFWAEAINMTCHATNCLYLHNLLKKIYYEFLTGNKPNIYYFRVFRSKCYVLRKRSKSFKFAPKVYEGFLLGYDSNSCVYHVFNVTIGCVETTWDAVFHETNDSQNEQVDLNLIDDEKTPCDTL
jgi:transposase InsO family protein